MANKGTSQDIDDIMRKAIFSDPKTWDEDSDTAEHGLEFINGQYFKNEGHIYKNVSNLNQLNLDGRDFGSAICLKVSDDFVVCIAEQTNPRFLKRTLIIMYANYRLRKREVFTLDKQNSFLITMSLPDVLVEVAKKSAPENSEME